MVFFKWTLLWLTAPIYLRGFTALPQSLQSATWDTEGPHLCLWARVGICTESLFSQPQGREASSLAIPAARSHQHVILRKAGSFQGRGVP